MKNLKVEEARTRILARALRLPSQSVSLSESLGRVLAQPVTARRDQPPFDSSSMDGWAVQTVKFSQTAKIVGESAAGSGFDGELGPGEAVRIFTGAPMPAGADAIIIQENAQSEGGQVRFSVSPKPGDNVRRRGGDFHSGETLLEAGMRLDPWRISLAAAAGAAQLQVCARPRIAILSTGEEIVEAGETPGPHAIFNSGGPALATLVRTWGGEALQLASVGDNLDAIEHSAREARCDVLITIGGASVGDHDLVKPALERLGLTYDVVSLNMRPGKPMWFGLLADGRRVLGLPGNPASAMVCAQLFLKPLLDAMQGAEASLPMTTAALTCALPANGPREHWMRAQWRIDQGVSQVTPWPEQDSSLVTVFARTNALVRRPGHAALSPAGEVVDILPLSRLA